MVFDANFERNGVNFTAVLAYKSDKYEMLGEEIRNCNLISDKCLPEGIKEHEKPIFTSKWGMMVFGLFRAKE